MNTYLFMNRIIPPSNQSFKSETYLTHDNFTLQYIL